MCRHGSILYGECFFSLLPLFYHHVCSGPYTANSKHPRVHVFGIVNSHRKRRVLSTRIATDFLRPEVNMCLETRSLPVSLEQYHTQTRMDQTVSVISYTCVQHLNNSQDAVYSVSASDVLQFEPWNLIECLRHNL